MRTIEVVQTHDECETPEVNVWEGKSARDVLKERYDDNHILKPAEQPRPVSSGIKRPKLYRVEDRRGVEKKQTEDVELEATLFELPD